MYEQSSNSYNSLELLLQRTGYQIQQENGQRIYYNPIHDNITPPRGCEVFVGKLPRDIFEDTLVPLLERAGEIYKLRLMMDFNGRNRGFCFVTYFFRDNANAAVKLLDGFEIRPRCKIGVFKSLDNTRLFVGGIPQDKKREEVLAAFTEFVDGIKDVIMYPSNVDQNVNRGYVFIEFETHRYAAIARRRLQPGSLILWDSNIMVDWAEPLPDPDPAIMSKVTKLYCRNLSVDLTIEKFEMEIQKIILFDYVHKVHKKYDYAFIHFTTRQAAEEGLQKLAGVDINGRRLEVMWARPEFYSNNFTRNVEPNHFCLSIPAKIRRIIRMRQNFRKKQPVSPVVTSNYIFPPPQPMVPFPTALPPRPVAFPNFFFMPDCQNGFIMGRQ